MTDYRPLNHTEKVVTTSMEDDGEVMGIGTIIVEQKIDGSVSTLTL